jgi:hypothetical protein
MGKRVKVIIRKVENGFLVKVDKGFLSHLRQYIAKDEKDVLNLVETEVKAL